MLITDFFLAIRNTGVLFLRHGYLHVSWNFYILKTLPVLPAKAYPILECAIRRIILYESVWLLYGYIADFFVAFLVL